ncbi:MAG: T9SS type A sorting domain-containing protein [Bacteroidia bacterium]|nr:T9SS type A sorting domain-containing protein [Bacteroidia bacterium]
MKRTLFLFVACLTFHVFVSGQSTLFYENFEGSTHQFTLNTPDKNSVTNGINKWVVNNAYAGGYDTLFCPNNVANFVPNTPDQPTAIFNYPNSNYLHITSLAANAQGIFNSCFEKSWFPCPLKENYFAMTSDISTAGYNWVSISFYWLCKAGLEYGGDIFYSTNSGATWTQYGSPQYNFGSNWVQDSFYVPAFDNQSTLRFGFRFVNHPGVIGLADDPVFSLDDIKVTGNLLGLIEVSALDSVYCQGDSIFIPFTITAPNYPIFSGNVFTAQLSDANGSFANPINLGTLTSVNAGTIAGIIPPGTPPGSGYKIRVNSSSAVITGVTYPLNITIDPYSVGGTASVNSSTICLGDSATLTLTGSAGNIQWESSTNGSTWVPLGISVPTFQYAPSGMTYFRATLSSSCSLDTSNVVTVNTVPQIQAGSLAVSADTVCAGNSVTITEAGGSGNITWQSSPNGTNWTPATGSGSTLNTGPLSQTTWFRAVFSNGVCPDLYSGVKIVTVIPLVAGGQLTSPTNSVCAGDSVLISLNGYTGNISLETSTNGITWNPAGSGNPSFYLHPGSPSTQVRAILSNFCGMDTSNVLNILMFPANVSGGISASADTVCAGNSTLITVAGGSGNISWETSPNGSTWSPATGNGPTLNTGPLAQTTWYRAVYSNGVCPDVFSVSLPVTVVNQVAGGLLTSQSNSVCAGNTVLLTLSGYTGSISWEYSTNGTTWIPTGSGTPTFSLLPGSSTTLVHAIVSNFCGTDTSNQLNISLYPLNSGGTLSADPDTICVGESAVLTLTNSQGTISWQSSINGTSWLPVSGNGATLNTGPLTQTTWFQASLSNGFCPTVNSPTAQVTVISTAASFTAAVNGLTVVFTDNSTSATAWLWTFGDGGTATSQNPTYTYAAPGTYTVVLIVNTDGHCPDTLSQSITVGPNGLEDYLVSGIKIYPNPAHDQVQVEVSGAIHQNLNCRLVDLLGRIQYQAMHKTDQQGKFSVNLSELTAGIYLIEVESPKGKYLQKLIIEP